MREGELLGSVGQKAEVTDAHEAIGEDVEEKAADEFLGIEGQRFQPIVIPSIPVAESDLAVFNGEDTVIGQSDAVGVAAEVVENGLRRTERFFRIDNPVLLT